tara:strand:+ start:1774 stop:2004 length:231 start_codon:yes stop_codon:yes gene_type:complete
MTSGDNKFELKMGKGNMFKNDPKKETDKHDFYGAIKMPRDIAAGEEIKLHGYRNKSEKTGKEYIGFQILDKRDADL